jgi:AraC-like DNA-binding protein
MADLPLSGSPLARFRALDTARPFHVLQNLLVNYADLPCFYIEAGEWKAWHVLVSPRSTQSPMNFEDYWQWQTRIRYNEAALRKACASGKPVSPARHGLHGLFVPVIDAAGKVVGVLQSGPFLMQVPSEAEVLGNWNRLTGRTARAHDPDFSAYVRSLVRTPVLDAQLVGGLSELFSLFGGFLAGRLTGAEVGEPMARIQEEIFARRLWHRFWVKWQVLEPTFFRFNGDPRTLMDWESKELGIRRFPSAVFAAKREGTGREWADWLAALAFLKESRRLARSLEETIAYPLNNYGALFLSSPPAGAGPGESRRNLREKALALRAGLASAFGCKVWIGCAQGAGSGLDLHEAYEQAITTLHVAVSKDLSVAFHDELETPVNGGTGLRHLIADLVRQARESGAAGGARIRDTFVEATLLAARGQPEAARGSFLEAFHRLFEVVELRGVLVGASLEALEGRLCGEIQGATNLNEMVGRFHGGLDTLLELLEPKTDGEKQLRLERARDELKASLEKDWSLPEAARAFGFSRTAFSREFSRFAGMPFSEFLLAERLKKAKRLLLESEQTPGMISEVCGFGSPNYFFQVFKREVGSSPGQFRERNAPKRT